MRIRMQGRLKDYKHKKSACNSFRSSKGKVGPVKERSYAHYGRTGTMHINSDTLDIHRVLGRKSTAKVTLPKFNLPA